MLIVNRQITLYSAAVYPLYQSWACINLYKNNWTRVEIVEIIMYVQYVFQMLCCQHNHHSFSDVDILICFFMLYSKLKERIVFLCFLRTYSNALLRSRKTVKCTYILLLHPLEVFLEPKHALLSWRTWNTIFYLVNFIFNH